MTDYKTVSAKVDQELKEKIAKYNIKVSKVIKKALEEEVKKEEERELKEMLKQSQKSLSKIGKDRTTELVKEGREER
ncbi:MAG: hypothetical protein R6U44_07325 [Archaeoglobaceae archaeon]